MESLCLRSRSMPQASPLQVLRLEFPEICSIEACDVARLYPVIFFVGDNVLRILPYTGLSYTSNHVLDSSHLKLIFSPLQNSSCQINLVRTNRNPTKQGAG